MMRRWPKLGYVIVAIGLLFAQDALTMPADDNLAVLLSLGYFTPTPSEPQLSSDGKTLYNAKPPVVVMVNPDPSHEPMQIPAPFDLLTVPPESATATFSITYVPNGGTDPWGRPCVTFLDAAKAAFDAAAGIWGNILQSSVPITINACWGSDFGSSTILGYSGGQPLRINFTGAPLSNTWYDGSLANALAGIDLDPSSFDMNITYNQNFSWYYGTDGATPSDQYDLMSVVLHEIGHGLNFSGSMTHAGTSGSWGYSTGYPNIYDTFVRDGSGNQLIDTGVYANPSSALGTALTSGNIWFHGTNAMAANGGVRVQMYAPSTWSGGSSYSHLDYNTFNNTINQLMVYAFSSGEYVHDPGPVTKGLLKDLGWSIASGGSPAIQVVSPNGGQNWAVGSTHAITWTSSNLSASGGIYIYYWYNGAWLNIFGPLSTSTTSQSWTIPDTPSSSAYVFVGNWVNGAWEVSDQSDQAFTIEEMHFIYVAQDGYCGGRIPCFTTIQNAIDSAQTPAIINISQDTYNEDVVLDEAKVLTAQGGWDSTFSDCLSSTTIKGSLTISDGTLNLGGISLE